jgi:AcrR family transcriptional regulator
MRTVNPERHARRRGSILEAAAALFAEHGFDRTTTAAICASAGIGSGTLFHYFPDKAAIFRALFADDLLETRTLVDGLDETDSLAAIFTLVEHRTADAGSPLVPGLVVAAIVRASQDPEFAALIEEDEMLLRKTFARLLRSAQAQRQVDAGLDVHRTARWLCGLVDALYFQADGTAFDAARDREMLRLIIRRMLQA